MTDTSRLIVRLVHAINDLSGKVKVAYTFDAGPNACLYLLDEDVKQVLALVRHFFPPPKDTKDSFVTGIKVDETEPSAVGPGPQIVTDPEESLFTPDGKPKL
ncbi:diphosphomevalonate decarboxylase [Elysia marginata]|uniref:Diphosphomevalonate decarboxylase n=1 Tax=Elysia marginata TaxID=1093978 RepID=A0AAV4FE23_9GAST|nr:diphosphomevalonate decarboxylase [Elysia marginata]